MYHQATILDGCLKQHQQKGKVLGISEKGSILACILTTMKNYDGVSWITQYQHTAQLSRKDPITYLIQSLQKSIIYDTTPFASTTYLL